MLTTYLQKAPRCWDSWAIPEKFVPIHWGMFELALHSWFEPIVKIDKLAMDRGINLVTPKIGEVINLEEKKSSQFFSLRSMRH